MKMILYIARSWHHRCLATINRNRRGYISIGNDESDIATPGCTTSPSSSSSDLPKPVFAAGMYICPWSKDTKKKSSDVFKMIYDKQISAKSQFLNYENTAETLQTRGIDVSKVSGSASSVTWLGHSSCLFRFGGSCGVLTDPVWSTRVGPPLLRVIGPKRFQSPPASIDSIIGYVDIVLISHSHYDHLDLEAVKSIGDAKFWIVPMGLKAILADIGIKNCIELNWWDSYTIDVRGRRVEIVLTPAKHWSARGLFDRNTTLWGSYVMISGSEKFFFGGDTAYCPVFKQIGEKYGPFDISCIPIGAYKPRWFMKDVHCDPSEALKIHQDIKSKKSIGIHWGTFPLADDDAIEPALELARAREIVSVSATDFFTTRHGDTYSVADSIDSVLEGDYALGQQPGLFGLFKITTIANNNNSNNNSNNNTTPG